MRRSPRTALAATAVSLAIILASAVAVINLGTFGTAAPVATQDRPLPQANRHDGVTITVTPRAPFAGSANWDFDVMLETHSQDLGDDLQRSSVLIDADGKPHAPVAWEGSPQGGHHRKGLLRFQALAPLPPSLELRIQRTEEADPRVFRWQLGGW